MLLAPAVPYTVQSLTIGEGLAGTLDTVRIMRAMVREASRDPVIRDAAMRLIWLQPARDSRSEIEAVFTWVRDMVRYVADPVWFESVSYPAQTLAMRHGDCDDKATLLGAMLESVGYPVRFVVTGYRVAAPEHVYVQVLASDQWIDLDPTERGGVGYAPPDPIFIWHERV